MREVEKLLKLVEDIRIIKIEEQHGEKVIRVESKKNKVRCPECKIFTKSIHVHLKPIKKLESNKYIVKVPNKEVKELFENIVNVWCYSAKSETLNYLISLKLDLFKESFQRLALEMFSFLNVDKDEDENF